MLPHEHTAGAGALLVPLFKLFRRFCFPLVTVIEKGMSEEQLMAKIILQNSIIMSKVNLNCFPYVNFSPYKFDEKICPFFKTFKVYVDSVLISQFFP